MHDSVCLGNTIVPVCPSLFFQIVKQEFIHNYDIVMRKFKSKLQLDKGNNGKM